MSPFWSSLFEHLKGCGRNATLFMFALAGFLVFLLLAAAVLEKGLHRYVAPALPWICLAVAILAWARMRRERARRRQRLPHSPLSRDELRVARSKLVKREDQKSP
jgi:hypothetical protein